MVGGVLAAFLETWNFPGISVHAVEASGRRSSWSNHGKAETAEIDRERYSSVFVPALFFDRDGGRGLASHGYCRRWLKEKWKGQAGNCLYSI